MVEESDDSRMPAPVITTFFILFQRKVVIVPIFALRARSAHLA